MSLPAGVTAYPAERRRPADPGWLGVLGPFLLVAGTVALAVLVYGADPLLTLLLAAVTAATAPVAALLRLPFVVGAAVVLGVGLGTLAWVASGQDAAFSLPLVWGAATAAGLAPAVMVLRRRWWARRLAGAEGVPPSGADPSQHRDVGTMATWRDARREYEAVEPRVELVLDAVRSLDGQDRTVVSVYRGRGRLDVGGDARGRLVVLQSDNRGLWQVVVRPDAPETEVVVAIGRERAPYPEQQTTDLAAAERAVRTWLDRGERDPGLEWWAGSSLTPPYRPKSLKLTD